MFSEGGRTEVVSAAYHTTAAGDGNAMSVVMQVAGNGWLRGAAKDTLKMGRVSELFANSTTTYLDCPYQRSGREPNENWRREATYINGIRQGES